MKSISRFFIVVFLAYGALIVLVAGGLSLTMPADALALRVVALAVFAGVGAVGAGLLLARNMTGSLTKLVGLVDAVAAGDQVDIELNRKDELGDLADAIRAMASRDKAVRQANEDPLTGLANRRYLLQRMEAVLKADKPISVLFLDLDGFKPINDEHGHEMGDEALKVVAERFGACVRDSDVLSRIGGDEFVMMFNGLDDLKVLESRAKRVLELVNEPIWINDTRLKMGASIGISVAPKDGKTPEELLGTADEAMYAAKQGGKNAFRFYS
jgi:diguanylate cyclase (GGDEF)-like protein